MTYQDRVAITGIGETEFAKGLEDSELALACRAIKSALDDAGIKSSEVDALSCFTMEDTPEFEIARNMGFGDITFFSQVPYGGGAACGAVGQVALAIASGVANVGVVWRSRKRGDHASRVWAQSDTRLLDHWKWSRPWGLLRPVDEVAMLARRYMNDNNVSREDLGQIALTLRQYANNNPKALMHDKPMGLDDYLSSRMISDPLCLFDNCLETDGAIALVLTSAERAKAGNNVPVLVHAFSQGLSHDHQLMTNFHSDDPFTGTSAASATNLWRQSNLGAKDVDVAQIYDAFAPLIWFTLEAYGFCERGKAAEFIADGGIGPEGALPVNTSGGGLSEAYVHGMNLVTEGVRQMRGTSHNQVNQARTCLVTACDVTPNGALILRRDA